MSEGHRWFGMPDEWSLGIVVPIFRGKGDIRKCHCDRTMLLLGHDSGVKGVGIEVSYNSDCWINDIWLYAPERNNL